MNDMTESATVVARPSGASAHALVAREAQDILVQMYCARQNPRDVIAARDRISNAFTRQGLCEVALYAYSRGGTEIQGLSIRAAEELARQWGNLRCGVVELTRQGGVSEVLAFAQDLETGFSDEKRFHVRHVRDTKQGSRPLTEDRDIYEHVANVAARRKRACILAVIPSDIAAEAEHQIGVTLRTKVDVTEARIKTMLDKFGELGVTADAIEKRIQRRVGTMLPQQFLQLGRIYNSITDGLSVAGDWFEIAPPAAEPAASSDPPSGTQEKPPETRTGELKEALRAQQQKASAPARKPDTPERGGVMKPPASAAKGAEAGHPDKPQRHEAKAASEGVKPQASAQPPAEPESDAIPHFDEQGAIDSLNACTTLGQFKDITAQIGDDYRDTERDVPQAVVDASEARQEVICIGLIQAATTIKKLNANYDRVVASYGPNVPDKVVEAFKSQQAKIEKAGR